jgi:hypothetical protein
MPGKIKEEKNGSWSIIELSKEDAFLLRSLIIDNKMRSDFRIVAQRFYKKNEETNDRIKKNSF